VWFGKIQQKSHFVESNKHIFIWKRFLEGSNEALSVIYFDHFDLLLNFGLKYVRDRLLIEDCIQNLFVDLMKNRGNLDAVQNVKFYLFKGLRNKILNELRAQKKQIIIDKLDELDFQISYSIEKSIIDTERDEMQQKFLEMVTQTLTSKQKEVLYLRFNCGFDYNQIAEVMNVNIDSVRTLSYRTFKQIKQTFGEYISTNLLLLHFQNMSKYSLSAS